MIYPIECHDEYGLEGIKNATDLASWINSWMADEDVLECKIVKTEDGLNALEHGEYLLAAAADNPSDLRQFFAISTPIGGAEPICRTFMAESTAHAKEQFDDAIQDEKLYWIVDSLNSQPIKTR